MTRNSDNLIFNQIYYINLDRRPDRNNNVEKLIKKHNLENITQRVSATDGKMLDLDKISNNIITKKGIDNAKDSKMRTGIPMTPGGIGCALSHLRCWNNIVQNELSAALILEDDIRFDDNFNNLIKEYSEYVPESYDILFIGYHPASIKYVDIQSPDKFLKSKKVYGLFGYIVTLQGAKKLLKLFPIEDQIDTEIYRGFTTHDIDAYVIRPELRLITSDPSEEAKEFGTDIQTREEIEKEEIKENFSKSSVMEDMFCLFMITIIVVLLFFLIDTFFQI